MGGKVNFNYLQGSGNLPTGTVGQGLTTGAASLNLQQLKNTQGTNTNNTALAPKSSEDNQVELADNFVDDTGANPLQTGNNPLSGANRGRITKLNLPENETITKIGSFQNRYIKTHRAEDVNAELFNGPVVTLSKYDQEKIIKSGFIDDIEGYETSDAEDCFSRVNSDGVREFLRVVNDDGNYKVIHTALGEDVNNTEVLSLNRKDISNFTMPENFQGTNKSGVKYDNLGNYHIAATSGMNTLSDVIKDVYGVDADSEEGQKIYDAILSKNALLNITGTESTIETGKDIVLVDKNELDAIEKAQAKGNIFNADVNIVSEYVKNDGTIPYLLLGPENPDPDVEYPVIVYLHGDGQKNKDESAMYKVNSPGGFMQELDLDNFNGYVICPQLTGTYYQNGWDNPTSEQYVRDLIDDFSETHNIDKDRIALTGASRGGMGTIYLAGKMEDVFCSAAPISGYATGVQPKDINIPIRGYVGKTAYGEDYGSTSYMQNIFAAQLGEGSLIEMDTSHTYAPKTAFEQDLDGDNCSDLIQWLFSEDNTKSDTASKNVTPSYFKQSEPTYPKNLIAIDSTPTSLNGDIRYVNWEDYGYCAETGQKFAESAKNVESRLVSKGIETKNNCLGGVKDIFADVTGESPFGAPSQGIRAASNCISVMENLEGYREITDITASELQYLPAGAIVVWSSSAAGTNPADLYGHISVSIGDGREASSKVNNQYTSVGESGTPRVFIPIY